MKAYQTPTTGQEWMSQVNRRLALIERHRHGAASAVTPEPQDQVAVSQWFAYGGFPAGTQQAITADSEWQGIYYPTLVYDATDMFDGETITAPRDGYLRVTATAHVYIGAGSGTGITAAIALFDQALGVEHARGNQVTFAQAALVGSPSSFALIVDSIISVTAGQQIRPAIYVDCLGRQKSIFSFPMTHIYGEYVDQPVLETTLISADAGNAAILGSDSLVYVPQQQGEPGPWATFDPRWETASTNFRIIVGAGGVIVARYKMLAEHTMALRYFFQWGSSGGNGGTGVSQFYLPPGYSTRSDQSEQTLHVKMYAPNGPNPGNGIGFAWVQPGASIVYPFSYESGGNGTQRPWGFSPDYPLGWYPNGNATATGIIEVAQEW